ncbi:MAG: MCP four helix bundle domain-containing protein, partial [Thermodesulfobacteriota bacterium]
MTWFYNLRMRTKLLTGFILVALIAGVVGFVGIKELNAISDGSTKLYEKITLPFSGLADMATAFQKVRVSLLEAIATEDPQEKAKIIDTITTLRAEISEKTVDFEKTILSDEERTKFDEFKKSQDSFGEIIKHVLPLVEADKDAEATTLMNGDGMKAGDYAQEVLDKLDEIKTKQAKLLDDENDAIAKSASRLMGAMVAVGILLAVGLGLFITSIVQGQLGGDPSEVADIAKRVAVGDMSLTIDMHGKNSDSVMAAMQKMVEALGSITANAREVARGNLMVELKKRSNEDELMESLQTMVEKLKEVVLEVQSSADNVAAGSQELSASAQEMSQGATEQAAAAEEASSSMEQMSSNIRQNADNALQTEKIAVKSASDAQ